MSAPYRSALPDDCLSCGLKCKSDFCDLPQATMENFNSVGYLSVFPGNVVLLSEGQMPRGVFMLCSGRAKLSITARDGKAVILNIASGHRVLGLSAVVSGRPSPVTVTTVEHCLVKFMERDQFLQFLERNSTAALASAVALSRDVTRTFHDVHKLLLARSSTEKLARLLLSWTAHQTGNHDLRVASDYTHEEMAQMIGSSRETVTRLLGDMKRRELIRLEGATLVIPNRIALQAIAS
jgi:CRP/FNR family transcriptional regulator, cyclic AMP receptor protein